MFEQGDKVWCLRQCRVGVVTGVDHQYEPYYYVQWEGNTFSVWEYSEDVVPLLDGTAPPMSEDVVNHPAHYNTGKIEVINFIEDQGLEYHESNALKYISRAGKKNPATRVEDLEKAVWYLNRKIALLKGENDG